MATPYLTPAVLRVSVAALADDSQFPDSTLAGIVAEFEEIAEDYLNVAYTPRTVTETVTVSRNASVVFLRPQVSAVSAFSLDGTAIAPTNYQLDTDTGAVVLASGWAGDVPAPVSGPSYSTGSLVVTYTHGYSTPTQRLLRGCTQYVRAVALSDRSGVARDVIARSVDGMTDRYSTPDPEKGRPTGFIEVDRLLSSMPRYLRAG